MSNSIINESGNQYTIIRGEEREIFITLVVSNYDFVPFDLSGRSDVQVKLPAENSSYLTLSETGGNIVVDNQTAGQLTITIDETNSNNLRIGSRQDFQINVLYAAKGPRSAYFAGRLNVKSPVGC